MTRGGFVIVSLALMVGCGSAPTAETTGSIDFTLERTIGRDVMLAFPRHVATLGDGTVLVGDGATIHRISPDGEHLGRFGERGSGPGEIEWLSTMVVNTDNEVLVWDHRSQRMTFWSGTGELLRSQPFNLPTSMVSILPNESGYTMAYALRPQDGEVSYWLHDYGIDLQEPPIEHTSYELAAMADMDGRTVLAGAGSLAHVNDGYVWVPRLYDGNLVHIDDTGTETIIAGMAVSGPLARHVDTREESNLSRFQAGNAWHIRVRYFGAGLFSMPGGGLLHAVWVDSYPNSPDPRTEITVFDADLDVSATRSLTRADSLGTPLHMDDHGRLYTVRSEPEPHIAVWRVEYKAE